MQVPRPDTMVSRTADTLRQMIQSGSIGPNLPGEPRLARSLGVARRTLRNALEILTREGRISESARGKTRQVIAHKRVKAAAESYHVAVLLPSPLDAMASGAQDLFRQLTQNLESDQCTVSYHHHPVYHLKSPESRLNQIVNEQAADLWLIYDASDAISDFFDDQNIPAVVCGGPVSEHKLAYIAYDGVATLRHAIGVLCRAGHTRISAPMHYQRAGRTEAFKEEMLNRDLPFDPDFHTPHWDNSPEKLIALLRQILGSPQRPTAIIINGMDAVIILYSVLLELGLTIPRDISVIISGSDPQFSYFHPQLSYYSTSQKKLAAAAARMIHRHLKNPGTPPRKEVLLMEYQAGKSVASPVQHAL